MYVVYPAVFLKNKQDPGYFVNFPDLEGCFTDGETQEEAFEMAQDVLGCYLYEYYAKNKEFPEASSIEDVLIHVDPEDEQYFITKSAFKTLVGLDVGKYAKETERKKVRKTVTIPSYLNEKGKALKVNFSKLLTDALEQEFEIE